VAHRGPPANWFSGAVAKFSLKWSKTRRSSAVKSFDRAKNDRSKAKTAASVDVDEPMIKLDAR
jgi:hypothetical protein